MRNSKVKLLSNEYLESYDKLKTIIYHQNINQYILKDLYLKLANELYELEINKQVIPAKDIILKKLVKENDRRSLLERITLFLSLISGLALILMSGLCLVNGFKQSYEMSLNSFVNLSLVIIFLNVHYLFRDMFSKLAWIFHIIIGISSILVIFILDERVINLPNYLFLIALGFTIFFSLSYFITSYKHYKQYQNNN